MDALVLPLVSGDDTPEAAIHQMRLAVAHAVVVAAGGQYRLVTNEEVLDAWGRGVQVLSDLWNSAAPAAALSEVSDQILAALGSAQGAFSLSAAKYSFGAPLYPLEPLLMPLMDQGPTDYGVVPALGGAAVVLTRHEPQADQIRSRIAVCRCQHSVTTIPEAPPVVQNGATCAHGSGTYRCC